VSAQDAPDNDAERRWRLLKLHLALIFGA